MGAVQTQQTYPRGLDFEQVWAALMENREQLKETDRIVKENARQQQKTDSELGKLSKRMGEVVEFMVAPGTNGELFFFPVPWNPFL